MFVFIFNRILDNMPVTWCYEVADEERKYCSTGFPIGCHVSEDGQARDACVTSVRAIPRETLKNTKISNAVFVIETYTSRNLIH